MHNYLLCDHAGGRAQPKLPPRSDLRGTAAPQADGPKYTSWERGQKGPRTHLRRTAGRGGEKEKEKETRRALPEAAFLAFSTNALFISLIRRSAGQRVSLGSCGIPGERDLKCVKLLRR